MARLNIDDDFWSNLVDLIAITGCKKKAAGEVLWFFKIAQDKYKKREFISEEEFKRHGFSEHLFPVFATRIAEGIQATDCDKYFGWLRSKVEAGRSGGKKSVESRKNQHGSAQPISNKEDKHSKQDRSTAEAQPKHPEASPSSSSFTTTTISDAQKFQDRFSPNNALLVSIFKNRILETINQHAECDIKYLSPGMEKRLSELGHLFGCSESRFVEWLNGILTSKKFDTMTGDEWSRYVIGAILKELG